MLLNKSEDRAGEILVEFFFFSKFMDRAAGSKLPIVLTSPNKDETAVHGRNPTLSDSVVSLSRKVNLFT